MGGRQKNGHSHAVRLQEQARILPAAQPVKDSGGYPLFSRGEIGVAHVLAHHLADAGRTEDGYRMLGAWLEGRRGTGRDWVHIQFHMAVFELGTGRWHEALERCRAHVLPAVASNDALTDAPALLWRLMLAAPQRVSLPWAAVRLAARRNLGSTGDAYVELHNLLALAGSGDVAGLDCWVETSAGDMDKSRVALLLQAAARALRALATHRYRLAADLFDGILPQLPLLGGSCEQNRLFTDIAAECRRRAPEAD